MNYSLFIGLFVSSLALGQIQTPQPSPYSEIEQTVGLTQVSLKYSRPAVRERVIMGDLVPYGEMWRAGANANTVLDFSDPVSIEGKALAAGKYALFIRPGVSIWEVFFYTETDNNGLPSEWNPNAVAAVIEAEVTTVDQKIESFTIAFNNLHQEGAIISIGWEYTQINLALEVPTASKTMASIEKTMQGTPKAQDYYSAAVYYRETNRDLKQAKIWISKAIELDEGKYWMYRQQALILKALNETEAAVEASKISLELAQKAGNQDYVRLNTKAIEAWSK